ncbi:thioredoxin family protein [Candidatus Latescibacterota bacterium]
MVKIQILGTGCPKCQELGQVANQAAVDLGLEYELVKVTDINEITGFGVMMTPALAVDGEVRVVGKVPSLDEVKQMLLG